VSSGGAAVSLSVGSSTDAFVSPATEAFAWTSRLAQQSLQSEFDPNLVRLFDGAAQGALDEAVAATGNQLAVSIDGATAGTPQVLLSTTFGFVDFVSDGGASAVRLARPVAVAETAGGQDDQLAVVRIRQNGQDQVSVELYRVDDFDGTIAGLRPGDPGYQAAAQARAYSTTAGGTEIAGPGYGNYAQVLVQDVDAGDLIAMQLTNVTRGSVFWAFAQANEVVDGQPVGHLWNYGLDTWGWEDTPGAGDRDYNDLIVGLDFTSASGQGWLV
jgi:hypothetical protein